MKKMFFHHPLPLDKNATSASGIRPIKMIEAFERLGYEVVEISGYGAERKKLIADLKNRISNGERFEFLYSESSTQPTLLTEKNHYPKYPFLDFGFFKFCKSHNIKIGLFYRDIYWLFSEYGKNLSSAKRNIAKVFYKYDLFQYKKLLDIVYLPSLKMADYIPYIEKNKFKALPPGHDEYESGRYDNDSEKIRLLYIGGLGNHYKMHKLFQTMSKTDFCHLSICTRQKEWLDIKNEYNMSNNISIVHKSGKELDDLYKNADIAMIFVEPQQYWEFAMPVKLFEYIGKEKPIIASNGTMTGEFVSKNDIGWSIDYDISNLENLLIQINQDKNQINLKIQNIKKLKHEHSWLARAKQVESDLI
ncbi:MAG: glycosyltransferase [Campylobacter sp.]|nr:glycosyltransferase [Campylobacter sp.]